MGGSLSNFTGELDKVNCKTCKCEAEDSRADRGDMRDEATPIYDDAVYFPGGVPNSVKTRNLSSAMGHPNGGGMDSDVYVITIDKRSGASKALGLDIQVKEGGLLIIRDISNGLIDQWNRANPLAQVSIGDRILEVNGAVDVASVMTTCRSDTMLRMVFQRAGAVALAATALRSPGSFYGAGLSPQSMKAPVGTLYAGSPMLQGSVSVQPGSVTMKMPYGVSRQVPQSAM
mmetsp:Transcript_21643/g.37983  ORF Transcript_21643/g.37983 Transcript_21643/m.37983 type:complete len:230 (+) Transcript_21643:122-811(+)